MKDNDRVVTMKEVKDAARLLLGKPGGLIPGAEVGIKALIGVLAVTAQLKGDKA